MPGLSGYWTPESLAQISASPGTDYATVIVKGVAYRNWKTVRVKLEFGSSWQEGQFSVAEPIDVKTSFETWPIKCGDHCQILLGGVQVINGVVEIREATYDANNHGLMIYVRSFGKTGADASVYFPPSEDSANFKDATYTEIMTRALEHTGLSINAPADHGLTWPNFQISFGETPWQVNDRLLKYLPGARTNDDGLTPVWHTQSANELPTGINASFIEGQNIIQAHATIDITGRYNFVDARGHRTNDDQVAPADGSVRGTATDPSVEQERFRAIWLNENSTQPLANNGALTEIRIVMQEVVHADVTVYGWFQAPGQLYNIGRQYWIYSPMLNLARVLFSKVVVFTQSENGTLTTVELCTPESLGAGFTSALIPRQAAPEQQGSFFGQGVNQGEAVDPTTPTTPAPPTTPSAEVSVGPVTSGSGP